jgi:hypothetical protein
MNLFDSALKASATQAMKDIFDSFRRTDKIKVYKSASEVYVTDSNYNADFSESVASSFLTQTPQYEEFYARIIFLDLQPSEKFIGGGGELSIKALQNYGRIKIQVEADGYTVLKDCKEVIFQSEKFVQEQDVRKVGVLGDIQFYSFIYRKIT